MRFKIHDRLLRACVVACALVPAGVNVVLGHGVEYQLSFDPQAGRIQSRQIVSTDVRPATLTALTRIYVMPFSVADGTTPALHPAAQAAWYTKPDITEYPSGNGLCYQWDTASPTGGQIAGSGWSWKDSTTLPNLAGTTFSYQFTERLLKWDGTQFTAAAAGVTQLQAFRGDATTAPTITTTTASGAALAYTPVSTATQSTNPHSNAGFRLLGDGVSFAPEATGPATDGIYMQGMQVASNATIPGGAGVGVSDPLYMVFYKNTSFEDAYAVAASFATAQAIPLNQIQAVPEPAGPMLVAGGAVLAAAGLKRRFRRWNGR